MYQERRCGNLRRTIKDAPEQEGKTMAMMARMLGPDKLLPVDELLSQPDPRAGQIMSLVVIGMSAMQAKIVIESMETPAEKLPKRILETPLWGFRLSGETAKTLDAAEIRTVESFVLRSREALATAGVNETALCETELELLHYGIRRVDNPPSESGFV